MIGIGQRVSGFRGPKKMQPWPPHSMQYNPRGKLSGNLWSLLLFENCRAVPGLRDYVTPSRAWTAYDGPNQTVTRTPFGGEALSFGIDLGESLTCTITNPTAPSVISLSFLSKFDGTGATGAAVGVSPIFNLGSGAVLRVSPGGTNQFTDINDNTFVGPVITTLSGWTRLTFTWTAAPLASAYVNGVLHSTAGVQAWNFAPSRFLLGWKWPTKDLFYWFGRVLTPLEVAAHAADPYGTTMCPKFYPFGIRGTSLFPPWIPPGILQLGA